MIPEGIYCPQFPVKGTMKKWLKQAFKNLWLSCLGTVCISESKAVPETASSGQSWEFIAGVWSLYLIIQARTSYFRKEWNGFYTVVFMTQGSVLLAFLPSAVLSTVVNLTRACSVLNSLFKDFYCYLFFIYLFCSLSLVIGSWAQCVWETRDVGCAWLWKKIPQAGMPRYCRVLMTIW